MGGLIKSSGKTYSTEENEIILALYPKYGPRGVHKHLPNRTVRAITQQAIALGVGVGDLTTRLTIGRVSRYTGLDRAGVRRRAIKDGVATSIARGKKLVVPIDWAERLKAEVDEWNQNSELEEYWYDVPQMAKLFGINARNITKATRGLGSLGHILTEIEWRAAKPPTGKYLFHPWQAEEYAARLRRGDPIVSDTQAYIISEMASGRELKRAKKGNGYRHGDYYFEAEWNTEDAKVLNGPAVRRSIKLKMIEYNSYHGTYSLTQKGREALQDYREKC